MTSTEPLEIEQSRAHPLRRVTIVVSHAVSFVLYLWVLAIEILLLLGFLLLLLGANPSSSFVDWVYRSMDRSMRPFRGIFEPIELGMAGNDVPSVFETSVLFAMVVYAIVALAVHALVTWLRSRLDRLDREDEMYRREQIALRTAPVPPSPTTATAPPPMPPATPPSPTA